MKYEIVSYQKSRGRKGVELRVGLAAAKSPEDKERPSLADLAMVVSVFDANNPLWSKDVGETVEIA